MSETIAAISTPPGEGGIGIIRVSGPQSLAVMKHIMKECPAEPEARHAYFGHVVRDAMSDEPGLCNEAVDEAVFLYMRGPNSYTGEDMLEVQAHGSNVSLRLILRSILSLQLPGIRMAEPGEFTKLAFLNGKMDLAQAEAVIDIIKAKSEFSLGVAERQREGHISRLIANIRSRLLDILAQMAVDIDYPDEDDENIGGSSTADNAALLLTAAADVEALLETSATGRIAREGIRIVIAGKPNAGKSSLMNALLGEGRVIVTDIPGTTRDTVEESASFGGIPVVLTDTAGLRNTNDPIERIGIDRTRQAVSDADIILLVIDGSRPLDDEDTSVIDYLGNTDKGRIIAAVNKEDLGISFTEGELREILPEAHILRTSLVGDGALDSIRLISDSVLEMLELGRIRSEESGIITAERHIHLLRKAASDLHEAAEMLQRGEPAEVAELSAHYAYDTLGEIIGEGIGEEILDTVFSRFCLGK